LRLLAKVVDILFVLTPFVVAGGLWAVLTVCSRSDSLPMFGSVTWRGLLSVLPYGLSAYVSLYVLYSITCHAARGRSIGKRICRIRVLIPPDIRDHWLYFLARFLVGVLSLTTLGVGHVVAAFRRDKRALHDLVVDSQVVKEEHG